MRFRIGDLVRTNGRSTWVSEDLYGIVLTVQGNKNGTVEVYWMDAKSRNHYAGALKLIARANR